MIESLLTWTLGLITLISVTSIDAPSHGGACKSRPTDGLSAAVVCHLAAPTMVAQGINPAAPYDWRACARGPCLSNLAELMRFLRCESWLHHDAYDEGWVGVDWEGNPVWNRSRGIAQIGDGWGHIATDTEAFNWRWSVVWLASDLDRMRSYPECGPANLKG